MPAVPLHCMAADPAMGHACYGLLWEGPCLLTASGFCLARPLRPVLHSGMWMALTFGEEEPVGWRPHGLMAPPENPFLREDLRPRVRSHWTKWRQQRAADEAVREPGVGLLPPAAAAAAAAGGPS